MVSILQRLKNTFLPSAEEGARRRQKVFGTTSKIPAIITAGSVLPVGRVVKGAVGLFRGASNVGKVTAVAGATAGAGKGIFNVVKGAYERTLGNPLAEGGLAGYGGRVLGRTIAGPSFAVGTAFIESAITGQPVDLSISKIAKSSIGFGLAGIPGLIVGSGIGFGKTAVDIVKQNLPETPFQAGVGVGEGLSSIGQGLGEFAQGLGGSFGGVSASYGGASASLSPSVTLGGGPDYQTALLLGLLGGGLGFALGRKRRKKRKNKKRGRHKKK